MTTTEAHSGVSIVKSGLYMASSETLYSYSAHDLQCLTITVALISFIHPMAEAKLSGTAGFPGVYRSSLLIQLDNSTQSYFYNSVYKSLRR